MVASVGRGYNVALLLRGWEAEAPRLVTQLLQMLFEEAQLLCHSHYGLSTLSLVQISSSGRTQDLLSPGLEDLTVLDVAPLGLVVEDATEVEVSDSQAASELYLQATGSKGRDCPLLRVLAGEVAGKEVEGSLPWIISWLLEGNNYSALLLHLNSQGGSLSLLQCALLGASERRKQVKQVKPTLWDAVEESQARRASLKTLRLGLLGDTLTDSAINQLGRALRELRIVKAWSQCPRSQIPKGVRAESVGLPEPQVCLFIQTPGNSIYACLFTGRIGSLGPRLHQKHPLWDLQEQQVPDVAQQFFLTRAQRQRQREQHQIWIHKQLKCLEQEEEVAGEQIKSMVTKEEACKERQRLHKEQTVLRLQVEALQAERDTAERDLVALYDMHVQATQARTCHLLQVFQAWQGQWEKQTMTTEQRYRSLLANVLQDNIDLALKNQELQLQNQQLLQSADHTEAVTLNFCQGQKPDQ
uniref:Riken cDNA E230025N22 gene n=1 Tax=Jaculus jaculus TaxID=51337 RepID=A0A8C5LAY3_JACJA